MTCDFCQQDKVDSHPRPLLRVVDDLGHRTVNPFRGRLCDNGYDRAQAFGTLVHDWVLNRIKRVDWGPPRKCKRTGRQSHHSAHPF
jgi:hypothetical protein